MDLNYDYMPVVKNIQELIINGVIDENYRIINLITEVQNPPPEDDIFLVSTSNDSSIIMSLASPQILKTQAKDKPS